MPPDCMSIPTTAPAMYPLDARLVNDNMVRPDHHDKARQNFGNPYVELLI